MEKLPLFGTFEKGLKNRWNGIITAINEKKWFTLVLYLFVTICFIIIAVGVVVGAISEIIDFLNQDEQTGKIETYSPPLLKLSYQKEAQTRDSEGIYHTSFLITINRPPGNFDERFRIITDIPKAECSDAVFKSSVSQWGSIASTTNTFDINCTSYQPIIDTKKLFTLGK